MQFIQVTIILVSFLFSSISVEKISSNFDKPLYVTVMPSNNSEILIVEQKGIIKLIKNNKTSKTPFLDITNRVHNPLFPGDERGLLGFAFDPAFADNGYFYVNYVNKDDFTIVSRFRTHDKLADNKTEKILIKLKQPYSNHNGGCIDFGHDGYLYISVGDGGSTGDPENRAQDLSNFFGSILRIDVKTDEDYLIPSDNPFIGKKGVKEEIWSYGLRNVWRFSFDNLTGNLIMGDVGQHLWEEINYIHKINEIVISSSYMSKDIKEYFRNGKNIGVDITHITSKKPLGTAGQLKKTEGVLNDNFIVLYGDSIFNFNILKALKYHKEKKRPQKPNDPIKLSKLKKKQITKE